METYIERGAEFADTRDAQDMVGASVLTQAGDAVGRVQEVRLHKETGALEGIVVRGKRLRVPHYICKAYLKRIAPGAIILGIEPAALWIGRKVVSADGKAFGKVVEVRREGRTRRISALLVRRPLFRKATIPFSHVTHSGQAFVIKSAHKDAGKRYGA